MNVKELREALAAYPDDMEIITSDPDGGWEIMTPDQLTQYAGVELEGYSNRCVISPFDMMREDIKARQKPYLHVGT